MKNIQYIMFMFVVAYTPFAAADVSHIDKSRIFLNAVSYPTIFRNSILTACNRSLQHADELKICQQSQTLSDEMILNVSAKYFAQIVSETNTEKLIAFWSGEDGMRITKGLLLEQQRGKHDVLSDADYDILEKFNQTPENKASIAFANNMDVNAQVVAEIEGILQTQ